MKRFLPAILLLSCAIQVGAQTPDDFLTSVRKSFAQWDSNHDGILSQKELDAVVADPKATNEIAAAAAALKRASFVTRTPFPPFTLESIEALTTQRKPNLALMFAQGLKRIANSANRELFPAGLPAMETIRQGRLGNCFCLAPLGAMVHRDPAQVAGMFSLQSSGTYRVQFGKKTVEVALPTDAEIAIGAVNEGGGIWVNLYEKAVGAARNEDRPVEKRVDLPLDAERGGSAGTMLAYITGHEITRFSFKFAKEPSSPDDFAAKLADLRRQLTEATQQNRLMTCGTIRPTTPGLTPNHAYAVLGYDAASDSVRLWNPHGQNFQPKGAPGLEGGYPTVNGVFQVPVDHFVRQFSGMAFEVVDANALPADKG
jgi:hypothetical protein